MADYSVRVHNVSKVYGSEEGSGLSFQPVFLPSTIFYAILVAVLVSVAAGVYPAWRASKMQPIDALRQL